jgi:hypothetical protein
LISCFSLRQPAPNDSGRGGGGRRGRRNEHRDHDLATLAAAG